MKFKELISKFKDIFFYKRLGKSLNGCRSVLDVGCGSNSPIREVKKRFYSEGIDIDKPSIIQSKKKKIHDRYIVGDIQDIDKYYKQKSFDAVISTDVIEHLEKKDALRLLKKMEKIARKKIIILTPNGFYHQDHLDKNPHQEHKSGWSVNDLTRIKYKVYGLRGLKYIRGEYATIKYKPWILWGFLAFITEVMLYYFPNFSYHLFAVKTLSDEK